MFRISPASKRPAKGSSQTADEAVEGDEKFLEGIEKMMQWRLSWQRAVARAWADPKYRTELLDPKTTHAALEKVGWQTPRGLTIEIRESTDLMWDPTAHKGTKDDPDPLNGWAFLNGQSRLDETLEALKTQVIFTLPNAPADDNLQALAIADYDGLSRAYPFTCACCC